MSRRETDIGNKEAGGEGKGGTLLVTDLCNYPMLQLESKCDLI